MKFELGRAVRLAPVFASLIALGFACGGDETVDPLDTSSASTTAATGSSASSTTAGTGGAACDGGPTLDPLAGASCDPLVPSQCGFPFPSNVYLVPDAATKTGHRVQFGPETLPRFKGGAPLDPALVGDSDGFSPGQGPMTHLPGATITGLPTQHDIDRSLAADSPTILIEAETGTRIPHFAELDMTAESDEDRTFQIRPVIRLDDDKRYIVAIRNVVDAGGVALPASPAFEALRDGKASDEPSVGARRCLYQDIFAKLEAAGVERSTLQIAWDYSTASRENNTGRMLAIRDDALAKVGAAGPSYVIDTVTEDPNPEIKRRLEGRMTVPLYLDKAEPGGAFVFGPDGAPMQNGTAEFPFIVQIPHAATTGTPGAILQNGHGLLGSRNEGRNGYLAKIANRGNFVTVSVDLVGFASEDQAFVAGAIAVNPMGFRAFIDRQHQGMLNQLLALRMLKGAFAADPQVQFNGVSAIDTTRAYYRGDSQGGIMGTTYMAISTDVTRGLLGEPGAPYNLLLHRSVDFDEFFGLIKAAYATHRDIQILLGLIQMLWDRTEPTGYLPYVTENPLPNTPAHQVLLHFATGDHQVTPLGAHFIARSVGAKLLEPPVRPIWGIETMAGPFMGSGIVEYDYAVPPLPDTNTPTTASSDTDPHDWVREEDTAIDQTTTFLTTGMIQGYCTGPCDPD